MPARRFDRGRMRSARRAADIIQSDVAATLGVSDSTVAAWETGPNVPDQEKLPALARALGHDLDDLFPRDGLPDLTDLRCDAGLYQYEVAAVIGTKSAGPVRGAEKGDRPLKSKYLPALAEAYGVTVEELEQAQNRSLGEPDGEEEPAADGPAAEVPSTLAEKITFLLKNSYPGQSAPEDEEIAAGVNEYAGATVITAAGVEALRTGEETDPPSVVREGLGNFFGVSPLYFEPSDVVARQVYEGLRLMSAMRKGKVGRVRARGMGPEGLSPNVLSILNDLAKELDQADPEADG